MTSRRRTVLPLLALLAACGGSGSASPGSIRLLNSIRGPASVDLFVDGSPSVGAIGFPGSSGYQSLPPGPHAIRFTDGTSGATLGQVDVTLTEAESVTVLASGIPGGAPATSATVLLDDDSAPAAGAARLRLVHGAAASAALAVDATLRPEGSAQPAAPSVLVGLGMAAYFLEVPAGRYSLEVVDSRTRAVVATFPTGPLEAGTVTTALLSDAAPGAGVPLRASYFTDRR